MSYEQQHRSSLTVKAQADFRGISKREIYRTKPALAVKAGTLGNKGTFEIGSPNLERLVMTLD
jgi:hypothetical protein